MPKDGRARSDQSRYKSAAVAPTLPLQGNPLPKPDNTIPVEWPTATKNKKSQFREAQS